MGNGVRPHMRSFMAVKETTVYVVVKSQFILKSLVSYVKKQLNNNGKNKLKKACLCKQKKIVSYSSKNE